MNNELIYHFWTTFFDISEDKLPTQQCIPEAVAIQMLKDEHPQLVGTTESLACTFRSISLYV